MRIIMQKYLNNTKLIIAAILTVSLLLFCSCGNTGSDSLGESSGNSAQNSADAASLSEAGTSGQNESVSEDATPSQSTSSGNSDEFFPQTLIDNDQITFTITSSSMSEISGLTWNVYMENKTESNLMFSLEKVSINDIMCEPYWAEVVSPGKNSTSQITWMPTNLERLEIDNATKVKFGLLVYDDDDYTAPTVEQNTYTVYPHGEESASSTIRTAKDSDVILLDNDVCTVTFTSWDPESDWGPALHLYITNKTEEDIMFSTQNVSLNDTMCDPYWASMISAGCSSDEALLWIADTVEEKGIGEISTITLPFTAYPDADVMQTLVEETLIVDVSEE